MAIYVCSETGKLFSVPPANAPTKRSSSALASSVETPAGRTALDAGSRSGRQTLRSRAAASVPDSRRQHRSDRRRAPAGPKRTAPGDDRQTGFLGRARVSALTRGRYEDSGRFVTAVGKAADFVRFPRLVAPQASDAALEGYIEKLYDGGSHKADVNYLIAAVSHLACWSRREFGSRCPRAAAAALGWARMEPDKSKEPCPGYWPP